MTELKQSTDSTSFSDNQEGIDAEEEDVVTPKKLTKQQICIVSNFCVANFSVGVYFSLLGPFFPQEAAKKGINSIVTGVVFSVLEFVIIVASPIFGAYMVQIGAKRLYVCGFIISSLSTISFGMMEYVPAGATFTVLCIVLRIIEGCGCAGLTTASFAMVANIFLDRMASMVANLELFTGLGFMTGPPIGGLLYKGGGFKLPFIVTGTMCTVVAVFSYFILPTQHLDSSKTQTESLMWSLVKVPVVLLMVLAISSGICAITFLDVALALRLSDVYNFSPTIIGGIFLIDPGIYTLCSPLWGFIADKKPRYSIVIITIGFLVAGIAFTFMGPMPLIPLPHDMLWLLLLTLAMMGLGIGTFVMAFQVMTIGAVEADLPENLETFGAVSGIFAMSISLGGFTGPLLGGYLLHTLKFEWAAFIFGCFLLLYSLVATIYLLVVSPRRKPSYQLTTMIELQQQETEFLVKSS